MKSDLIFSGLWLSLIIVNIVSYIKLYNEENFPTFIKYFFSLLWFFFLSYNFIKHLVDYIVFSLRG